MKVAEEQQELETTEEASKEEVTPVVEEETVAEEQAVEETKEVAEEAALKETPAPAAEEEAAAPLASDGPHKWYIIHAYSGFEKKVADAIKEQAAKKDMTDLFAAVEVPTEIIVEVKKGKKVNTERKFFPGYVLAKMIMNDDTWHLVKNTPKVTGFIGGDQNKPLPISNAEADRIFKQVQDGIDAPRHKVIFQIGDQVKVIDGPFDSFVGSIEDVDEDRERLRVSVSIFGRPTPLELEYTQVEKA